MRKNKNPDFLPLNKELSNFYSQHRSSRISFVTRKCFKIERGASTFQLCSMGKADQQSLMLPNTQKIQSLWVIFLLCIFFLHINCNNEACQTWTPKADTILPIPYKQLHKGNSSTYQANCLQNMPSRDFYLQNYKHMQSVMFCLHEGVIIH